MNDYEAKQAARKARYAERAKTLEAEAQALYEYDRKLMSVIPFGQPILVGHHSEKSHRTMLKRSWQRMAKIQLLNEKADYYRRLAASKNCAISSDDEDAIAKLKHKLARLEAYQVEMKRINAEYRKGGFDAITGLSEPRKEQLKASMQLCHWEKAPFPRWKLTNNGAEIRRVKQRIAELEAKAQQSPSEAIQGKGYKVTENPADNRIWFEFDEKPIPAICQIMRQQGFKWSPSRRAWVRMLNGAGRYHVDCVIEAIRPLFASKETA